MIGATRAWPGACFRDPDRMNRLLPALAVALLSYSAGALAMGDDRVMESLLYRIDADITNKRVVDPPAICADLLQGFLKSPDNTVTITQADCEAAAAQYVAELRETPQQKTARLAKERPAKLDAALAAALKSGRLLDACAKAVGDQGALKCGSDLDQRYRGAVSAKGFKVVTCGQWAIRDGAKWSGAKDGMRANALSISTNPATFDGTIDAADRGVIVVRNFSADNAYVYVDDNVPRFGAEEIKIGSKVYGFGYQTGTRQVTLNDGSATTIPVLAAHCIEAAAPF